MSRNAILVPHIQNSATLPWGLVLLKEQRASIFHLAGNHLAEY